MPNTTHVIENQTIKVQRTQVEWRDNSAVAFCTECGWRAAGKKGLESKRNLAIAHTRKTGHETHAESTAAWIDTFAANKDPNPEPVAGESK